MKPNKIQVTPNTGWAKKFWENLSPLKERIVNHPYFQDMAIGKLSLKKFQKGLINFYPLVENFPKFMALNVAKTRVHEVKGHAKARDWLMENMSVERRHADWWRSWAKGFHCTDQMLDDIRPNPAMDAINHYLWSINSRKSLIEGLAATNLAIEWPTGEWASKVVSGIRLYQQRGDALKGVNTVMWLKAHVEYDDHHPYEAMEIIKLCTTTASERNDAFLAAKRGMEYYLLALDDCYQ